MILTLAVETCQRADKATYRSSEACISAVNDNKMHGMLTIIVSECKLLASVQGNPEPNTGDLWWHTMTA